MTSSLPPTSTLSAAPISALSATSAELVEATLARIEADARLPERETARAQIAAAMDSKVKPIGSLGRLEELAVRIAGIRATTELGKLGAQGGLGGESAIVVCAADHGITAEGVSPYPSEVTGLMLGSYAAGGAAVCVLCARNDTRLVVADFGTVDPPDCVGNTVLDRNVRRGTANSAVEEAMTHDEALLAIRHGIEIAQALADEGVTLIGLGEMGIGNTTTASAMTARLLGVDPAVVCGPGTGLDSEKVRHKVEVVRRVLARHTEAREPVDVLAAMGGLEVAGLVGVVLGAAASRVPVVLDGFITTAAALVAVGMAPAAGDALIAGHVSAEPGHAIQLERLGLKPVLALDMRLGEGSGAAVAIGVIRQSLDILADMATYAELGIGGHAG